MMAEKLRILVVGKMSSELMVRLVHSNYRWVEIEVFKQVLSEMHCIRHRLDSSIDLPVFCCLYRLDLCAPFLQIITVKMPMICFKHLR